jgi:hypothetical protein
MNAGSARERAEHAAGATGQEGHYLCWKVHLVLQSKEGALRSRRSRAFPAIPAFSPGMRR